MTQTATSPIERIKNDRDLVREIWRMGYPSMIGFAATNLYTLADMFWVSRLGADRVAAITIFAAFYWVISSANQVAGVGSLAIIARRFGQKNMDATKTAMVEAFTLKMLLAAVFGSIGYLLVPYIVVMLGAEGDIIGYAVSYGRIMLVSLVFNFPTWTLFTALRSIGQPRAAMILMLASTSLNAALDPFMIFGWWGFPALGVAGAAWASLISFGITLIGGLFMFFAGAFNLRLDTASVRRMHARTLWQMFRIGLPAGISSISFSLGRMVITPMVAHFGAPVIAIYGAGNRVIELGIVVVVGLELGTSPLIGHALGARDKLLAWATAKKAVLMGAVLMAGFGVLMALLADPLTRIFFEGAPYHELGRMFFWINAISMPFLGVFIVFEGAFSGAGDTVPVMVITIIHSWLLEIPFVWVLGYLLDLGPTGIWWGFVFSSMITATIFFYWFSRKRWLEREV